MMSDVSSMGASHKEPVVFEYIAIEAFRGFNSRVEFDLDASVVIVSGPNGMGKTSLFDAIQWLLLGALPRVASARLRTTEEHIVNAYRVGEKATVSARVRFGERSVSLTRVGNRSSSNLSWTELGSQSLHGLDAEAALASAFSASEQMDLQTSLTACGLLQQDAARLVLQAKPKDRFATFSQLLGLADLEKFEDWTQARERQRSQVLANASEALLGAERASAHARDTLARALELAAQRPGVETVQRRLADTVAGFSILRVAPAATREEAVTVVAAAQRMSTELAELTSTLGNLAGDDVQRISSSDLESELGRLGDELTRAEQSLTAGRAALTAARSALAAARSAQEGLAQMAAVVLPLLTGHDCPVCGQAINVEDVRRHLEELSGDNGAVTALSSSVAELAAEAQTREASTNLIRGQILGLRAQLQQVRGRQQELQLFTERVRVLRSGGVIDLAAEPTIDKRGLVWLHEARLEATLLLGANQEFLAALDASGGVEEARASQASSSAEANVRAMQATKRQAELMYNEASLLHGAASAARRDVVQSEFARLSPVAQDVYSRLDPHPTFTELELETDVLRSASTATARVRDREQDVEADPMVIFSAAQANIAAISYLVALNWTTASRVPVLMLDDPLQAMDDINVLGFADLCRHLRLQRQVIVSTHERRFAQLLERKLTPRDDRDRTIVHEFTGWERSGPMIKERSLRAV